MRPGGKRQGAGRPKGAGKSPQTKIIESIVREAAKAGETPLEYMLRVMVECSATEPDRADKMAIAAAPYMHVKRTETEVKGGATVVMTEFDASVC